jgi:nucleoside phosphorylase
MKMAGDSGDKVDVVIVTAIEVERQAMCQALQMGDGDRIYKGVHVYWKKQVAINDQQYYEIVVTQLSDAATLDAALGVSEAIAHWHPEAILMVGIAGIARDSVHLEDVVVGQAIAYYERGKDTWQGQLPEPRQYPADEMLWIHVANNRKIDAIEMEGYGVSTAAWKRERPVRCLVIRGISDRADAPKNDLWQPYAAAAAFTKHFLQDQHLAPHRFPIRTAGGYSLIIDDLKNGSLVPFLGPGINASFYIDLALKLADFVQEALL